MWVLFAVVVFTVSGLFTVICGVVAVVFCLCDLLMADSGDTQ